MFVERAISMR